MLGIQIPDAFRAEAVAAVEHIHQFGAIAKCVAIAARQEFYPAIPLGGDDERADEGRQMLLDFQLTSSSSPRGCRGPFCRLGRVAGRGA